MGSLAFTGYKGIKSELSPKLLESGYAVTATNCFLDSGALTAWKGLTEIATLGKTGEIKTLHLLGGTTWMHFNEVAQVALAPIANNDKFYSVITGLGSPQYTNTDLATSGGGSSWPNFTFTLGFPPPALTLDATVNVGTVVGLRCQWTIAGTEADAIGNKLPYTYVYTYADAEGREGPPSEPSDIAHASKDDKITLTNIDTLSGAYNPTGAVQRFYRSENGSPFQFLAERPSTTADFIDDFTLVAGSAVETTLYSAPPAMLKGVVVMANGIMAGYVGNDIYLSSPFQPHGWPEDYILHTDYPCTGLVAYGNALIVCTEKYPYSANVTHPSTASLDKMETIQGNLNIRSLIELDGGAMYASNDGLVFISVGGASLATGNVISEKTWREMNPSSIHGYFYRGNYFGFYNAGTGSINTENGETIPAKGGFIFDVQRQYVTYTDVYATAAYSDLGTSSLYLVIDDAGTNKVFKWNDNATPLSYVYESKPVVLPETTMTAARFELKSGAIDFELWVDKALKFSKTVADNKPFRMPSGYKAKEFAIRLSGTGETDAVFIATSPSELT